MKVSNNLTYKPIIAVSIFNLKSIQCLKIVIIYILRKPCDMVRAKMICTNIALLIYLLFYHFFVKNIQYNLTDFETEYYEIHLMNSKENGASFYYEEKSLR